LLLLCVILVFLSPPEPPETSYSDTDLNNMLAVVSTPQQLARQVGGSVKCDSGSTVAEATRLIVRASGTTLDCGVCFPSESFIATSAYASSQVLRFGSLVYIADCHDELCLLHGAAPVGNEPSMSPPPSGPSRADLEVLAQQIRCSLGLDPTVLDHCQMFYMLANVHL
jgi:hypothetical protein